MNYIYGYRNKINNKWYVGQTTMKLEERHRTHISGATHEKASDYNCLFHKKLREYGIENFELVILEEVANKEELDDKERYWIKEKKSFVKDGQGYNTTMGGQKRKNGEDYWDIRCSLTKEQALEIINLLSTTQIPQTEIAKQYGVHIGIINQINTGKKYRMLQDKEYPIRKKIASITADETVEAIISLLKQGYGNVEIAEMLGNGLRPGTVSAINIGDKHRRPDIIYPIRKETNKDKDKKDKANQIKKLLEEGKLNNKQIAEVVNCDPSVVSRINSGKTYRDQNRIYPIRK